MTTWLPDLSALSGPRYRRIADAIAADIASGTLTPGDRLPPHRDLAYRLKVTVGTVSRAYAEAERRALVSGEIGRGTYILEGAPGSTAPPPPGLIDFTQAHPFPGDEGVLLAATLKEIAAGGDLSDLLHYQPHLGRPRDRAAAAKFLADSGHPADPASIALVGSGQHGIAMALAAVTEPGDIVALEAMTYPGFKAAAQQRRLKLEPIAVDAEGLLPDAFAAACRAMPVRALALTPNLSNPLGGVLSPERRRQIVETARRHDVWIIEDDVYGFLVDRPPAFATLAPERTLLVTSLSKCAGAGLRIGFVTAPPGRLDRLALAIRASVWMVPPLMAEIATRWIEDGTVARLAAEKRAGAAQRQALARRILGNRAPDAGSSYYFWLTLPDAWAPAEFTAEAGRRGIAIAAGTAFAVERVPSHHGVRVCISGPAGDAAVARGLTVLAGLVAEEPDGLLAVV